MDGNRKLIEALVGMRERAETTAVVIVAEGVVTRLLLTGGLVVAVEDSEPGEPLGRVLLRQRHITQEQYVDALERMTEARAAGERLRFGEVAVLLGYADARQVRAALFEQMKNRALRALRRRAPTWSTSPLPLGRDPKHDARMHVERLVLDALSWMDDGQKRALALDELWHERIGAAWSWDDIETRFDLDVATARFARTSLEGNLSVEAIVMSDEGKRIDASTLIAALLVTGAAVSRVDSRETLSRLFSSAAPPPRPRRVAEPLPAWELEDANNVREALARAQHVKQSLPPQPLGDVEQRLRAEQAFQRGQALLASNRVREAVHTFVDAHALDPACPEYTLFAAWAEHRSSGGTAMGPAREELVRLAAEAHARQPMLALPVFVLAEGAREVGDTRAAEAHMRLVARLDPSFHGRGGALTRPSTPDELEVAALRAAALPPPAISFAATLPMAAAPALPPPAAAPAAPSPSAPQAPAPRSAPPSRSSTGWIAVLAVLSVAGSALGFGLLRTGSAPPAVTRPVPSAVPPAPPPTSSAVPIAAGAATIAAAAAVADAGQALVAPVEDASVRGEPSRPPADARSGLLELLPAQLNHRVYVDGKLVGEAKPSMRVPCGARRVKIGSRGREIAVDVPCGGSTRVPGG